MPIQYRCPACNQLLSISTRKAGQEVPCPQCGVNAIVPQPGSVPSESATAEPVVDDAVVPPVQTADQRPTIDHPRRAAHPEPERLFEDPLVPPSAHAEARHAAVIAADDVAAANEDAGGFQLRRSNPNLGELDLTSMVDVTFLLLIFFMVTASFSLQKTIEVPPPKQDQKGAAQSLTIEDLQANTIFVKIDERNAIFVDDVPAGNPAGLADVLTKARLTTLRTELAIDAHNDTLHETVVLVIDAATEAGMQKIRIVSRAAGNE